MKQCKDMTRRAALQTAVGALVAAPLVVRLLPGGIVRVITAYAETE